MKSVLRVLGGMLLATACAAQTAPVTAPVTVPAAAPAAPSVPAAAPADAPATVAPAKPAAVAPVRRPDWAAMGRYKAENDSLEAPAAGEPRVVFFGDSITDVWGRKPEAPVFFPGKHYINRGISGQTTPQMIVRFHQDVVNLHPKVVLILAGTNDVAENTGPMTPEMTVDNFRAMVEMARANGIVPVIASVTPAAEFGWRKGLEPAPKIRALNEQLKAYCIAQNIVWVDYYSAMADENGAMKPGLSLEGVHPSAAGYAVMAPLAEAGIEQALKQK